MVIRLRRKFASLCICHALLVVNNHGLSGLFSLFSLFGLFHFLPLLVCSLSVSPIHRFIVSLILLPRFPVSLIAHPSSAFQFVIANILLIFLMKQSHFLPSRYSVSFRFFCFSGLWSYVSGLKSAFLRIFCRMLVFFLQWLPS